MRLVTSTFAAAAFVVAIGLATFTSHAGPNEARLATPAIARLVAAHAAELAEEEEMQETTAIQGQWDQTEEEGAPVAVTTPLALEGLRRTLREPAPVQAANPPIGVVANAASQSSPSNLRIELQSSPYVHPMQGGRSQPGAIAETESVQQGVDIENPDDSASPVPSTRRAVPTDRLVIDGDLPSQRQANPTPATPDGPTAAPAGPTAAPAATAPNPAPGLQSAVPSPEYGCDVTERDLGVFIPPYQ